MLEIYEKILKMVPDWSSWKEALHFLEIGQQAISSPVFPDPLSPGCITKIEWKDLKEDRDTFFGLYSSNSWRRFVLATFLADLVSYTRPADQVSFDRLLFVMHTFPQGFRTWWVKHRDGKWWPIGYTGWYPMSLELFESLKKEPEKLKNRMVVPEIGFLEDPNPIYLFNYSIAPPFRKTLLAKQLMKTFVQEIHPIAKEGLAAMVVSSDGVRIANQFGMSCSGRLKGGEGDLVYILDRAPSCHDVFK